LSNWDERGFAAGGSLWQLQNLLTELGSFDPPSLSPVPAGPKMLTWTDTNHGV
jgi:hypothetical protein